MWKECSRRVLRKNRLVGGPENEITLARREDIDEKHAASIDLYNGKQKLLWNGGGEEVDPRVSGTQSIPRTWHGEHQYSGKGG